MFCWKYKPVYDFIAIKADGLNTDIRTHRPRLFDLLHERHNPATPTASSAGSYVINWTECRDLSGSDTAMLRLCLVPPAIDRIHSGADLTGSIRLCCSLVPVSVEQDRRFSCALSVVWASWTAAETRFNGIYCIRLLQLCTSL